MFIEKVFELIRKEDIVLWAGSGLSIYGGFPSGKELSSLIYESLSVPEKNEINKNLPLADLAEQFVRLKGGSRQPLISILKDIYSKEPASIKWHELIANIPHIKTIITTNYDNLFELAYKQECIKLVSDTDIVYVGDKNEIFKVHGDLSFPDRIIIAKSDYSNFFLNSDQTNLYWTIVIERISSKSVLFVGYDFEDENIKNVFEKISETLKRNQKEIFLIAPKLAVHKVNYLARLGIQYIDITGESFVEQLYANIKANITNDFERGLISPETLRKFFYKNGLLVDLKAAEEKYKLSSISGLNGKVEGKLSMMLRNDSEIIRKFENFISGQEFGEFSMDNNHIENFNFQASDIDILKGNEGEFKLVFSSVPFREGQVDVIFSGGFELSEINYKIYTSNKLLQAEASYKDAKITCTIARQNADGRIDFTFDRPEIFQKTKDAIEIYTLLQHIANGTSFKIYTTGMKDPLSFTPQSKQKFAESAEKYLHYYDLMKQVEDCYSVRFLNIDSPTDEYYENIKTALRFANNKEHVMSWDHYIEMELLNYDDNSIEQLKKISGSGTPVTAEEPVAMELDIHGISICLGYKMIEIVDPYVVDIDNIDFKIEPLLKIRSKCNKVRMRFATNRVADTNIG